MVVQEAPSPIVEEPQEEVEISMLQTDAINKNQKVFKQANKILDKMELLNLVQTGKAFFPRKTKAERVPKKPRAKTELRPEEAIPVSASPEWLRAKNKEREPIPLATQKLIEKYSTNRDVRSRAEKDFDDR